MTKRLTKKKAAHAGRRPRRIVRVERPRANRFHTFLRRLQAGGRSNMYGAIPYLMHAFELDRDTAFRVVCEWVDQQQGSEAAPRAESSAGR